MSKGSIVTLVVLLVLVLGGFLGFKEYQKMESAAEGRTDAMNLLMGSKVLQENRAYVEGLVDRHHAEAFKAGFKQPSLFAPTEFDGQRYLEVMWERMAASANADKRTDIAEALPSLKVGTRQPGGVMIPE